MADPITILTTVIGGLVSVFTAYTNYKAATKQAEAKQVTAPVKDEQVVKGEQAASMIETMVTTHGKPEEQTVLTGFQQNPEMFKTMLANALLEMAKRTPTVAEQLQALAKSQGLPAGSGGVNISGSAKVYGAVVGTNTGEITGTYTFGKEDEEK